MKAQIAGACRTQEEILDEEIRRSEESRYNHRLHGVLLVSRGLSCRQAAALIGDSARAVGYWVRNFERFGVEGLREGGHPGRSPRLPESQQKVVRQALRRTPAAAGLTADQWNGRVLSNYLRSKLGVELGVRQCQRLFALIGPTSSQS
ncbi:MAG: helix-turn-helix domain-containing protein [Acidobacteria bacterium]|nr:helix-turn-helix domain-containing protein [Acidobacteriota bacterium]